MVSCRENKKSISRSFEHIKHYLSTYAHFYRPEYVGRERNYIQSQTQTLNAEGIRALKVHIESFIKK